MADQDRLTNHEITICLAGGAVLGPFRATWTREQNHDIRELARDFEAFLEGGGVDGGQQARWRYHLHDTDRKVAHTLILDFRQVTAVYDHVDLRDHR